MEKEKLTANEARKITSESLATVESICTDILYQSKKGLNSIVVLNSLLSNELINDIKDLGYKVIQGDNTCSTLITW